MKYHSLFAMATAFHFCAAAVQAAKHSLEAGQGNYADPIIIPSPNNANNTTFERNNSYVRVSIEGWFINKQSSFWTERMASGTCEAQLGTQDYNVALGNYELANGATKAPVIGKVVVDNSVWIGGDLELKLFMQANQSNTLLATALKSLAQSSAGIASSVATSYASQIASGPYGPLASAGKGLITSVQNILSAGPKPLQIFELNNGFDYTTPLSAFKGGTNYILFFRGTAGLVTPETLVIKENSGQADVLVNGQPLDDGAWMLVKVENNSAYDKARPWDDEAYHLTTDISDLMDNFTLGLISSSNAMAKLLPSDLENKPAVSTNQTLGDKLEALETLIANDDVLSYNERNADIAKNRTAWKLAIVACRSNSPPLYTQGMAALHVSLVAGTAPENSTAKSAFEESFISSSEKILSRYIPTANSAAPVVNPKTIWTASGKIISAQKAMGQHIGF